MSVSWRSLHRQSVSVSPRSCDELVLGERVTNERHCSWPSEARHLECVVLTPGAYVTRPNEMLSMYTVVGVFYGEIAAD